MSEFAALVVAELAATAVAHVRVKGRGFRLTLTDETGRGLLLVDALTARWGTEPWPPSGKVVWAEIGLPHPVPTASASGAQPSRAHVHETPGDTQAAAATAHAREKAPSRP
ncbi:hypothetical protein [Streptomyces sp. NBC_01483]|uniref:hypothetical protein n=1 Tax=Streptomyces sp. NBC_01483 TaxID=2903883 RepID=UPI002E381C5F|nr:hypothetical protein [Streptomyces sp. NBC_01483]